MKARLAALLVLAAATATLSAAADPQLLNLVMPDAQVMAGVNVEQAKTTPFGQYVLSQIQPEDQHLQELATLTGFDPRRDVRELLVASPGGNDPHAGLALARGNFDVARIASAAQSKGATVQNYNGATILLDPKKQGAFAFPDSTTVVAGTIELVRAAIDRRGKTTGSISPALSTKVQQLSTTQDAWLVSLVPPSSLRGGHGPAGVQGLPNQDALQKVEQLNAGIKFGANVVVSAEALAQTAQDATALAGVVQFLASLAQMQSNGNPDVATLVKALTVSTQGQTVKVGLSVPYTQFENMIKPKAHAPRRPKKV